MAHFKVSSQKQYPPGFITFSLSFEGGSYRGCAKVTKRLFFFLFFLACGSIALKHVLIALWIALLMSLLACKQLVQRKYVCLPFVIAVPGTGPSSQWSPGMCVQKHLSYISFQQSPSPLFEVSACTRGRHLPGWFSLSKKIQVRRKDEHLAPFLSGREKSNSMNLKIEKSLNWGSDRRLHGTGGVW